ncbi:MAG: hypothetical protein OMOMHJEC_02490 [Xanthomonadales bacterium]|nr:hypothetical protein [Xanthomonadales bacterium]
MDAKDAKKSKQGRKGKQSLVPIQWLANCRSP